MALREYNWPAAQDTTDVIALSQSVVAAGVTPVSLVLNGAYSEGPAYNQNTPGQYFVVPNVSGASSNFVHQLQDAPVQYVVPFPGFFRTIRITSTANVSALTFHVTGTYAGQILQEDIAGPNATFTEGVNFYDTILSITATGVAATYAGIKVGLGLTGGLAFFNFDWKQPFSSMSLEVIVPSLGSVINYTFGVTLQDVQTLPFSSLFLFDPASLTNANTSQFASTNILVFRYATIRITQGGGGTDATGSLQAIFLQGGI